MWEAPVTPWSQAGLDRARAGSPGLSRTSTLFCSEFHTVEFGDVEGDEPLCRLAVATVELRLGGDARDNLALGAFLRGALCEGGLDTHGVIFKSRHHGGELACGFSKLGITCSIGLGSSKTVAKIASERDKPHGLTIVIPGTERAFLSPLPVRAMSGIGAAAERMLNERGIRTLGAIASARQSDLIAVFGVNADLMRERAQGRELSAVSPIDAPEDVKSVSNERTFAHDLIERADIEAAIVLLGESIARRMRRKALLGNTVTLKLKYSWGAGKTIQRRLPHPTDDENVFVPVALSLLSLVWSEGMHVRLAGLAMSDFGSPKEIQTDLFCTLDERGAQTSERRKLSVTIDHVREKFGEGAVGFGRAARFDGDIVRKDKYMHKED